MCQKFFILYHHLVGECRGSTTYPQEHIKRHSTPQTLWHPKPLHWSRQLRPQCVRHPLLAPKSKSNLQSVIVRERSSFFPSEPRAASEKVNLSKLMAKKEERLGRERKREGKEKRGFSSLGLRRSPLARALVSRARILPRLKRKIRDCSQSKSVIKVHF